MINAPGIRMPNKEHFPIHELLIISLHKIKFYKRK